MKLEHIENPLYPMNSTEILDKNVDYHEDKRNSGDDDDDEISNSDTDDNIDNLTFDNELREMKEDAYGFKNLFSIDDTEIKVCTVEMSNEDYETCEPKPCDRSSNASKTNEKEES